jgi:predicted nucleotide-binding protein
MTLVLPPIRPRVFIGCAGRASAIKTANALKSQLGSDITANVWNEHMITLDHLDPNLPERRGAVMANLYKTARIYDFVLMMLGADDLVVKRYDDKETPVMGTPRDNVLFELGLFMGALGNRRAIVVLEPGVGLEDLSLPSDLDKHQFNHQIVTLSSDPAEFAEQVAAIAQTIVTACGEAGLSMLPSTGLAIGYFDNFIKPVCRYLRQPQFEVSGQSLRADSTDFVMDIVIPETLAEAGFAARKQFVDTNTFQFDERSVILGRPYSFFVRKEDGSRLLRIADYPTPLSTSAAAISLILGDELKLLESVKFLHDSLTPAQLLEQREIDNFERTLAILLWREADHGCDEASRTFPERVRLRRQRLDVPLSWN